MTPTEHSWFYTPWKRLDLGGLHASSSVWRHLWLEVEGRTNDDSETWKEKRQKEIPPSFSTFHLLFSLFESWVVLSVLSTWNFSVVEGRLGVQAATARSVPMRGGGGGEVSRMTEQGWRMWVEREVGWGFALTFTLTPQLMLRCCHFHHLKCCHFRCRSLAFAMGSRGVEGGREGKREEVWEDFHFKQAQLCHTVTWLPWHPLFNVSQLPVSSLLLSCLLLFRCLPSSFSRTL